MPVKIFVPKIPNNDEEFTSFIKKICNPANVRISKNKDGSAFSIINLNYNDDVKCATDIIKEINGKVIGEVVLKPRIYVDQSLLGKLSNNSNGNFKESSDDVVNTTHFSKGFYFVQLLSEKDTNIVLTSHLENLYKEYKAGTAVPVTPDDMTVSKMYATFYENDNQFYRVRLLDKLVGRKVKVEFVDFGNEEVLDGALLFEVSDKVSQVAPMVHKCRIHGVKIINKKKEELVAREVLHRNFRSKLIKKRDDTLKMDRAVYLDYLDFASVSYRNYLIIEDVAEEIKLNGAVSTTPPDAKNGFKDERAPVIITHFESLDEFYVQPVNKLTNDNMETLTNLISVFLTNINDQMQYMGPEHLYMSQFSQDGNWYRCRVTEDRFDSTEADCVVQYIDFGNSERKTSPGDLRPLVEKCGPCATELASIPACATRCRFSDDLLYALSKAKMEKEYFQENFVVCEKTALFEYYFDKSSKAWVVENIQMDKDEDIMTVVLRHCDKTNVERDLYRLTNLESLGKIWLRQVKSMDAVVQDQMAKLDRWTKDGGHERDLIPARQLHHDAIYCGKSATAPMSRCRVLGRNAHNVIVQQLDTGLYDTVSLDAIYELEHSLAAIPPLAKSFRLVLDGDILCAEPSQIEDKIRQIVGSANVELVMVEDGCIRDVIVKEKSLVQCLAQLDYIQVVAPKSQVLTSDLPDCLLPPVTGETSDVDFSLPSVERMDEVPAEIAILNGQVKLMRMVFGVGGVDNVFEQLSAVIGACNKLSSLTDCSRQIDELTGALDGLAEEFSLVSSNFRMKLRDLDSLIGRRTELCREVCSLKSRHDELLEQFPCDTLDRLVQDISRMTTSVDQLMAILQISVDRSCNNDIDIRTTQALVASFRDSDLLHQLLVTLEMHATATDDIACRHRDMMAIMYRNYCLGEHIPTSSTAAVPLIDRTFELHAALKAENAHFIRMLDQPDVLDQFNVLNVLLNFYFYLHKQRTSIDMVVVKTAKLVTLHEYACSILHDDSHTFLKIEDNHRRIIAFRSALKHNIADMEDAEEQDERDKAEEITTKIALIRKSLHESLNASMDIIDANVRKLMLKKPELQLKNQSIFFCPEGIPVFLWDSIFFDMPSSVDLFHTQFGSEHVHMRKLSLTNDNYRTVLHNLTTYSSRTSSLHQDDWIVSLLPIKFAFLSKVDHTTVYMILPHYHVGEHLLPLHISTSLVSIVNFFKSTIDLLMNLWHLGFTFSDSDLQDGLFVVCDTNGPSTRLCLPLPLNSILNRENISHKCDSIQVYFSRLGLLFLQMVANCTQCSSIDDADVQLIAKDLANCSNVEQAEKVFEDLNQFATRNTPVLRDDSTVLEHDLSIEQLCLEEDHNTTVEMQHDVEDHHHDHHHDKQQHYQLESDVTDEDDVGEHGGECDQHDQVHLDKDGEHHQDEESVSDDDDDRCQLVLSTSQDTNQVHPMAS